MFPVMHQDHGDVAGAYWEGEWFQVTWSNHLEFEQAPIAAKEMVPILAAAAVLTSHSTGRGKRSTTLNQL